MQLKYRKFSSIFFASQAIPFQAISRCVSLLDFRDAYSWLELCKTISINLDANFDSNMVSRDHSFLCLNATTWLLCQESQGKSCLLIIWGNPAFFGTQVHHHNITNLTRFCASLITTTAAPTCVIIFYCIHHLCLRK